MMMTGAPIKLTQADAADVADLYNRCSDYFLLQDGAAPTLDDARELFSDVPPEKSAHNQAVLGGPVGPKLRFWPSRRTFWERGIRY